MKRSNKIKNDKNNVKDLGKMYKDLKEEMKYKDLGVEKDYKKAMNWLLLSSNQGFSKA